MNIKKIETNYKRNLFFHETKNIKFQKDVDNIEMQVINIYPENIFEEFLGFGGAFTESTCYNVCLLKNEKKEQVLDEYFGENSLGYQICRVAIASSDFSVKSYSYSNKEDLSDFSISKDMEYVIPIIKMAQKRNMGLEFLASPWSPPKFMKSNKSLYHGGKLLDKYKKTWANYLVKYIKAYKDQNINIKYMTIQNEPNASQVWESCLYTAEEEIELVEKHIYPTFVLNNIKTKLFMWDHNKEQLLNRAKASLNTNKRRDMISGLAFHWYTGDHFDAVRLTRKEFPTKLLFHTEGCTGYSKFKKIDEIVNAEIYGHDIIQDLNSGINAFIDWNMVLDYQGGPNHKNNFCNAPIMLNKEKTDYIKLLPYYYIGHFSKYIKPGATRIGHSQYNSSIEVTAFKNIDHSIVVVLLNRNDINYEYNFKINGNVFHDNLDKHAIITFIIK